MAGTGPARPKTAAPDPWEHITPEWLPADPIVQTAYRRVVQRGLRWLDAHGRRAERPDLFNQLEHRLVDPFALFLVERKNLPPGQFEHVVLLLLLAYDAAIPLSAADRLASLSGPTPSMTVPKPKTPKRPKGRSSHKGRTP